MFNKLLIVALFFAASTGCRSKSAFNFSQEITTKEKSLLPDIKRTEKDVEKFVTAEQYDSIAEAGAKMEAIVQKKIDEIKKMPLPKAKGAADFKEAALRYFGYIKKMYTGYKEWGSAPTGEEREQELNKIRDLVEDKQKAIDDMQKVQRKFADANGFKVE